MWNRFKCLFGFHFWSDWDQYSPNWKGRECSRCGKTNHARARPHLYGN